MPKIPDSAERAMSVGFQLLFSVADAVRHADVSNNDWHGP